MPSRHACLRASQLAIAIWHIRDPLVQWARLVGNKTDIDAFVAQTPSIQICHDLANQQKHLGGENNSGRNPQIESVGFDTSQSGAIELYYDGGRKEKCLVVSESTPIPFGVRLTMGSAMVDDITAVFEDALRAWFRLIDQLGILSTQHAESMILRDRIADFVSQPARPIVELPYPPP